MAGRTRRKLPYGSEMMEEEVRRHGRSFAWLCLCTHVSEFESGVYSMMERVAVIFVERPPWIVTIALTNSSFLSSESAWTDRTHLLLPGDTATIAIVALLAGGRGLLLDPRLSVLPLGCDGHSSTILSIHHCNSVPVFNIIAGSCARLCQCNLPAMD